MFSKVFSKPAKSPLSTLLPGPTPPFYLFLTEQKTTLKADSGTFALPKKVPATEENGYF